MTGNRSSSVRLVAVLLGVSKHRAHQITDEPGFPAPIGRDGRGRSWDRRRSEARRRGERRVRR